MEKNYIMFKEYGKEYTWYYENILGDEGLIAGLRELYSYWSVSIVKVVIDYKEDEMWMDWL